MIGAIIGDIVGSRYEFDNIHTKEFELFDDSCSYTDDTLMTIAIGQALQTCDEWGEIEHHEWSYIADEAAYQMRLIAKAYPRYDWGGRFEQWLKDESMGPYNSFGNGAAMRVSTVADFCAYSCNKLLDAHNLATAVTRVTHNHPEGIKGATTIAELQLKLRHHTVSLDDIPREVPYKIPTMDELRHYYAYNETCQGTVPAALACLIESTSFEDAIRNAISIGGDSDTLAAIVGTLAEEYWGIPQNIVDKALTYLPAPLRKWCEDYMTEHPANIIKED